jgi:hypothetical protein
MIAGSVIPAIIATTVSMPIETLAVLRQADNKKRIYRTTLDIMRTVRPTKLYTGYLWRLTAYTVEISGFGMFKDLYNKIF